MAELERDLREVGRLVAFPPEPELVPGVRARLGEARAARGFGALGRRRALVLALAVLVVGLGAAFAVPSARTAILRFFHVGGETIERVETLPNAPRRSPVAGLAGPMSVEDATDRAGFNPILPRRHSGMYAQDGILATYVAPRVVLMEARSELGMTKKVVTEDTRVEPVRVNDHDGLWIAGAPHVIFYFDSNGFGKTNDVRSAGNTLVWAVGSVTLRLEGPLTQAQALSLASSIR
jgi:hypothetical protein